MDGDGRPFGDGGQLVGIDGLPGPQVHAGGGHGIIGIARGGGGHDGGGGGHVARGGGDELLHHIAALAVVLHLVVVALGAHNGDGRALGDAIHQRGSGRRAAAHIHLHRRNGRKGIGLRRSGNTHGHQQQHRRQPYVLPTDPCLRLTHIFALRILFLTTGHSRIFHHKPMVTHG